MSLLLHKIMCKIRLMESSLDCFIDNSKDIIEANSGKQLTKEPCVFEENWLVSIFYIKEDDTIKFIFTCINQVKLKAYAVTSDNISCPKFLVIMAHQMYKLIPSSVH